MNNVQLLNTEKKLDAHMHVMEIVLVVDVVNIQRNQQIQLAICSMMLLMGLYNCKHNGRRKET